MPQADVRVQPGGMFDQAGIDIGCIQAIVPNVRAVLDAARAAEMPIAYLKMGFRPDLRDAGLPDGPTWIEHLPLHANDPIGQRVRGHLVGSSVRPAIRRRCSRCSDGSNAHGQGAVVPPSPASRAETTASARLAAPSLAKIPDT